MDLIFRFGTHYYESGDTSFLTQVLISFIGAFFGFGFALAVYYYQTKRDKLNEWRKEEKDCEDKLTYYDLLLGNIIKYLQFQNEHIKDCVTLQKKNTLEPQALKRIASNDLIRIQSIDSRGIFEAFSLHFRDNHNWINTYQELNSCLDYLDRLNKETDNYHTVSYNNITAEIGHINQLIEFIPKGLHTLKLGPTNPFGRSSVEMEIIQFAKKYIKLYMTLVEDNSSVQEFESKLINPLHEELITHKERYHFAEEFISYCQTVKTKLRNLENDVDEYINSLENSVISIDKHIDKIIKIKNELKTCPNKSNRCATP